MVNVQPRFNFSDEIIILNLKFSFNGRTDPSACGSNGPPQPYDENRPVYHRYSVSVKLCCGEPRSCVKVKVAVVGSPSLISLMVSVDVKQHRNENCVVCVKVEVAVLGSLSIISLIYIYYFCGRKATQERKAMSCV